MPRTLVLKMGNQRLDSAWFQFYAARIFVADHDAKKVAEYLARAFRAGFSNNELCYRFADLKTLATTNAAVKAVLEVKAAGKFKIPNIGSPTKVRGIALVLENKSDFPLTNVKVKTAFSQ